MINKIFSNYSKTNTNSVMCNTRHIHKDIFQDENAPQGRKDKKNHVQKDYVMDYLLIDFQSKGYKHGYSDHHEETRSRHLEIIKGDFVIVCQRMIDVYSSRVDELLFHLMKVNGSSISAKQMVERQISSYNKMMDELNNQIKLSIEGDGKIKTALLKYIDGFNRGLSDYTQEEIIGNPTGFFN